ncbi:MAG: ester cyclase [Miltoncostaeaceae bacterium]
MSHNDHVSATIDAFNAGDMDTYRELVGDAVYVEPATGREVSGDAFIEALQGWRAAFPDITGTITRQVDSGGTNVSEITWAGTHNGPLAMPQGELPPTGNPVTNPAAMVSEYDGDTLIRITHYFDMLTVLRAAGAA